MLSLLLTLFLQPARAFPEMIRHHYVNCSACHVANAGGGLLNAYGRSISAEVLSSVGTQKEARAFYTVDPEKIGQWLNVGGDMRGLQYHQDNENVTRGGFIWMEANLKAAATLGKLTTAVSVGKVEQSNQSLKLVPTQYYASFQFSDELSVRAGLYVPVYGLNIPQHNYLVRQNLQMGPGSERQAVDLQYNGEKYNFTAGISKSTLSSAVHDEELAFNFQALMNINDQHKVGFNYWYGEADKYRVIKVGLQGVLGWTESLYSLAELDQVWNKDSNDVETQSFYQLFKTGYEIQKGLHLQAVQQFGKTDISGSSEIQSLGAGLLWYPRPHFEIESLWSKRRNSAQTSLFEDYAYLVLHYYF